MKRQNNNILIKDWSNNILFEGYYKDSLVDELEILIAKERGKVCADLFSDRKKYDLEDDDLYIHQKEVETNYVNQDING